jgi:hypothetical protein
MVMADGSVRDRKNPSRYGRNEAEANRRFAHCLVNLEIGHHGVSETVAEATVRASYPELYHQEAV